MSKKYMSVMCAINLKTKNTIAGWRCIFRGGDFSGSSIFFHGLEKLPTTKTPLGGRWR